MVREGRTNDLTDKIHLLTRPLNVSYKVTESVFHVIIPVLKNTRHVLLNKKYIYIYCNLFHLLCVFFFFFCGGLSSEFNHVVYCNDDDDDDNDENGNYTNNVNN